MEILVVVISWLVFGGASSYFASQRGRDPFAWFMIGMLLGILGLLLLFLLPPLEASEGEKPQTEELESDAPVFVELLPGETYKIKDWFYLDAHRSQVGPVNYNQLKEAWDEGKLSQKTLVWCEGMDLWQKIEELSDLKEGLLKANEQ